MDIYQASADTPDQLTLAKQAIFSTRDGMLLFPQWPKIIKRNDDDNHWPFLPQFNAQYSTLHDRRRAALIFSKTSPPIILFIYNSIMVTNPARSR